MRFRVSSSQNDKLQVPNPKFQRKTSADCFKSQCFLGSGAWNLGFISLIRKISIVSAIGVLYLWAFGPSLTVNGQSFDRITDRVGLGMVSGTNGVALADYDQDGDIDVYFVSKAAFDPDNSNSWNRLFENRGNGVFAPVASDTILAGRGSSSQESPMGHKMGASWGDYDNDGWPDLYLTNYGLNQLLKNNGDGSFSDVTVHAGVAGGASQLSSSSLWWDFDSDGDLDLYVSNYEHLGGGERNIENLLYENLGEDRFQEIGAASGLNDAGMTWTTVAIDVNNDGRLDLYLANDFGPNKLYVNEGDGSFSEQTSVPITWKMSFTEWASRWLIVMPMAFSTSI